MARPYRPADARCASAGGVVRIGAGPPGRAVSGFLRWRPRRHGGGAMTRGRIGALTVAAVLAATGLAACGSDDDDGGGTTAAPATSAAPADTTAAAPADTTASTDSTTASKCGLGNGQKATGEPIKIGAIATKQPGTDFTDIPNTAKAFFDCVNDNGGINGRPIQYVIETEQTDPGQVASLAKKLVETEKVLGIVGNTSIIECAVNHGYYE